jgi:hypothetical protein
MMKITINSYKRWGFFWRLWLSLVLKHIRNNIQADDFLQVTVMINLEIFADSHPCSPKFSKVSAKDWLRALVLLSKFMVNEAFISPVAAPMKTTMRTKIWWWNIRSQPGNVMECQGDPTGIKMCKKRLVNEVVNVKPACLTTFFTLRDQNLH